MHRAGVARDQRVGEMGKPRRLDAREVVWTDRAAPT